MVRIMDRLTGRSPIQFIKLLGNLSRRLAALLFL